MTDLPLTTPKTKKANPVFFILRIVVVLILLGACATIVGLKYMEWKTLKALSDLNNQTLSSELAQIQEGETLIDKLIPPEQQASISAAAKSMSDSSATSSDDTSTQPTTITRAIILQSFDDGAKKIDDNLNTSSAIIQSFNKYIELLNKDKAAYEAFQPQLKYLTGEKREFAQKLINAQLDFYASEIPETGMQLASYYFTRDRAIVGKDQLMLSKFMVMTHGSSDRSAVTHDLTVIAPLEKYTHDDFKFEHEDEIRTELPYSFESLNKMKKFYAATYAVLKELAADDLRSAEYKSGALQTATLDMQAIDEKRIHDEGKGHELDLKRGEVEGLLKRAQLIREFESQKWGAYPILKPISDLKQNLADCELYIYKTDLFHGQFNKYPQATTWDGFLDELTQVLPKTDDIDHSFDRNAVKVNNDDKQRMTFECSDPVGNQTYKFRFEK